MMWFKSLVICCWYVRCKTLLGQIYVLIRSWLSRIKSKCECIAFIKTYAKGNNDTNWRLSFYWCKPHLFMKDGSLFCFVLMRSTKLRCFRSCSWCLWKALNKDGCMGFGSMVFGFVVQKFLNIEWFLHWKLN
jgi:hypothetical protein